MSVNVAQAEETAETGAATVEASTTEVDVACGNQGAFCDALLSGQAARA